MRLGTLLNLNKRLLWLAGAHDPLGARLVAGAGFDGVWASSLELATANGVPDSDVLTPAQLVAAAAALAAAVSVPVVADAETGFDGPATVRSMVHGYEAAGVQAVCLEDGCFPHQNSLLACAHGLAPIPEFVAKIEAAVNARRCDDFLVLARVQALIAGRDLAEARRRADAYVAAGADAIVIHSRSPQADEILAFVADWDRPTPLILIPTTYHAITGRQMQATGKVRLVIYANHGLRAAVAAMQRVFRQILDDDTSHDAENWIAPLDELFALQQPPPLTGKGDA
jgi:phosphoenolpyruvate phosphomutase